MIQRYGRFGGLMISALVSRLSGPGLSTGFNTRHFTYTVPFSTQVYKWVSASLKLGLLVSHPGRSKNISNGLIIHVNGNLQDKHWNLVVWTKLG